MKQQNHHYLPKSYLKRWSPNYSNSVWRYGIDRNGNFLSNFGSVKSMCSEANLYKRTQAIPEREYIIETDFFKKLDNDANLVINKIIQNGILGLSNKERSQLVAFMMGLIIRRPDSVHKIKEMSQKEFDKEFNKPEFIEEYKKTLSDHSGAPLTPLDFMKIYNPDKYFNFGVDRIPNIITGKVNSKFHELFINMEWLVKDFDKTEGYLLTSDNPLYRINGMDHVDHQFAFPLSPQKALIAVHRRDYYWKLVAETGKGILERLNLAVVKQARNWIVALDDSYYELAKKNIGLNKENNSI